MRACRKVSDRRTAPRALPTPPRSRHLARAFRGGKGMAEREVLANAVNLGDLFVVIGWFGLLALAIVAGVAYLRARA